MQTRIEPSLEHEEYDQHSKEDARGCVINLEVKLGVQVSEIWARGTYTTRISNYHQAISLVIVKGKARKG